MSLKLDRLIDNEFEHSYKDFYYGIKKPLVGSGVSIELFMKFDSDGNLLNVPSDKNRNMVNNLTQLIQSTTIFRFLNVSKRSQDAEIRNTASLLYEPSLFPLYPTDEEIKCVIKTPEGDELILESKDMNSCLQKINTNKFLSKFKTTHGFRILLTVRLLKECESRKIFEETMFGDDFQSTISDSIMGDCVSNYLYEQLSVENKLKLLSFVYSSEIFEEIEIKYKKIKSADKALMYLHIGRSKMEIDLSKETDNIEMYLKNAKIRQNKILSNFTEEDN